jgi:hypothetical protein
MNSLKRFFSQILPSWQDDQDQSEESENDQETSKKFDLVKRNRHGMAAQKHTGM